MARISIKKSKNSFNYAILLHTLYIAWLVYLTVAQHGGLKW